jgi:hypothetical protein
MPRLEPVQPELFDAAEPAGEAPRPAPTPLFRFDPGWLFLLSGIALVAATVLIPAQHDLDMAHWQRDRAVAIEKHRQERLLRYGSYLDALKRQDESVVLSLTAMQLNQSPIDRVPLTPLADPAMTSASVFPSLEPDALTLPPKPEITPESSRLMRWTTSDGTRLWLLAGGVLCILIGLLPASTRRDPRSITG